MPASCPLRVLLDWRLLAWTGIWTAVSLLAFGLVTAIIPNPVFARQIPAEPFAIWTWLLSAPLMGLVMATYTVPPKPSPIVMVSLQPGEAAVVERRSTTLGSLAGLGAFLAIGCPVCNKIALLLLGTSGAMSVYAPIQPVIGAVSLALLVGTAAWRLRLRANGGACPA
ncbi:MAG TPA: hypothetical protein VES19_09720 [Candidatus Limnocylindrales bacterium]|nr:hypothetical protein [Candidatus Limnocylindrales bacterium]